MNYVIEMEYKMSWILVVDILIFWLTCKIVMAENDDFVNWTENKKFIYLLINHVQLPRTAGQLSVKEDILFS